MLHQRESGAEPTSAAGPTLSVSHPDDDCAPPERLRSREHARLFRNRTVARRRAAARQRAARARPRSEERGPRRPALRPATPAVGKCSPGSLALRPRRLRPVGTSAPARAGALVPGRRSRGVRVRGPLRARGAFGAVRARSGGECARSERVRPCEHAQSFRRGAVASADRCGRGRVACGSGAIRRRVRLVGTSAPARAGAVVSARRSAVRGGSDPARPGRVRRGPRPARPPRPRSSPRRGRRPCRWPA